MNNSALLILTATGIILYGCSATKKIIVADTQIATKCAALTQSYERFARDVEIDSKLIDHLKTLLKDDSCDDLEEKVKAEVMKNSILSRLNYDIYFISRERPPKLEFMDAAKQCISLTDEKYKSEIAKSDDMRRFYMKPPSQREQKVNSVSANEVMKHAITQAFSDRSIWGRAFESYQLSRNSSDRISINQNLSIVDLEIMSCMANQGYCAYNDGLLSYKHSFVQGRIWDGEKFVSAESPACQPDYCKPVNLQSTVGLNPLSDSIPNLCKVKK